MRELTAKKLERYNRLKDLEQAVERAWMLSHGTDDIELARLDKLHVLLVDARTQARRAVAEYLDANCGEKD